MADRRRDFEHRLQLRRSDRLADVVVHAGGEAQLTVAGHGVRRHGGDPRTGRCRPAGTDPTRRLEPVELGHLDVHEHQVVGLRLERRDRLQPVAGHVRAVAQLLEQAERELLVHRVVLGDQDAQRVTVTEQRCARRGPYVVDGLVRVGEDAMEGVQER